MTTAAGPAMAVGLYVRQDILNSLKWTLNEFFKHLSVTRITNVEDLGNDLQYGDIRTVFLEADILPAPLTAYLQRLKEMRPSLNILLVVSPLMNKEDLIEIIRQNLVRGILVRSFTGEIVCKYTEKLCQPDAG